MVAIVEWVCNAVEMSGLDIRGPQLGKLVREYRSTAKELGHKAARRHIAETLSQLEYRAVASMFLSGQLA